MPVDPLNKAVTFFFGIVQAGLGSIFDAFEAFLLQGSPYSGLGNRVIGRVLFVDYISYFFSSLAAKGIIRLQSSNDLVFFSWGQFSWAAFSKAFCSIFGKNTAAARLITAFFSLGYKGREASRRVTSYFAYLSPCVALGVKCEGLDPNTKIEFGRHRES